MLLFTSCLDRSLQSRTGTGAPTLLATLGVHPVGILSRVVDIVVSAHGTSFTKGPSFTATNAMLVLDRDGAVLRRVAVPDGLFLNGLVELAPDVILVADGLAGRIFRFDSTDGTMDTWLADPLLKVAPVAQDRRPGANGLKVRDRWLFVLNPSRGAIHRVRIAGTVPVDAPKTSATTGPVDDFAILPDGTTAAATYGDWLIRVGADGTVSDILSKGGDGCTSIAPFGADGDLVVLTTGDFLQGGAVPARVLTVTVTK